MPFEKVEDVEAIDNERRKALAKSIRISDMVGFVSIRLLPLKALNPTGARTSKTSRHKEVISLRLRNGY